MDERAPGNYRKSISVPAAHDIFLILERGKLKIIIIIIIIINQTSLRSLL